MGKIFDALTKSGAAKQAPTARAEHWVDEDQFSAAEVVDLFEEDQHPPGPALPLRAESAGRIPSSKITDQNLEVQYDEDRLNKNLVTFFRPHAFEAEQFKILRTTILHHMPAGALRTIMITSAVPGEGKSFVAANLAASIAQNIKEHVLLMDCDIRKPCLHTRLGYGAGPGLSEYLTDGRPLTSLLLKTAIPKLTLLPAGRSPRNPSELLSSERMFGLIEEAKQRYSDRYIVIDAPPANLTAEAGAIARQVDGILLVIKYGSTPRDLVAGIVETLGKESILGVVLNRITTPLSSYYGYGKYGKYYSKYHPQKRTFFKR